VPLRFRFGAGIAVARLRIVTVLLEAKLSERVLKSALTVTSAAPVDPSPAGEMYSPPSLPTKFAAPLSGTADAGVAAPKECAPMVPPSPPGACVFHTPKD
jgi:hypothetical protein